MLKHEVVFSALNQIEGHVSIIVSCPRGNPLVKYPPYLIHGY
jgi:hypothetical protein